MPISVNINGVGKVNFPDNYTLEQIQGAIENDILPNANKVPQGSDMGEFTSGVQGFNEVVPFGNRMTAGMGAVIAAPFSERSIPELYNQARQNQQVTEEANPKSNMAGMGVGILSTLPAAVMTGGNAATPILGKVANAASKGTQAIGNFVRGAEVADTASKGARATNLAGQMLRGAAVSAPSSALYGYGDTESDLRSKEAYRDALQAGGVGAAAGGASVLAGNLLVKGINKLATPKNIAPNSEQFSDMGKVAYKQAYDSGEEFTPDDVTNKFVEAIELAKPSKIAGEVETDLALELEKALGKYKKTTGKPLTIKEIDIIDKDVSNIKDQAYNLGKNQLGSELGNIQNTLRGSVADAPSGKTLAEARDFFRRKYQMEDLERIYRRAEGRPNEAAIIQTGFRNLANQARNKGSGYTKEQIAIMDKAAKGGLDIDALKVLSSRLLPMFFGAAGGPASAAGAYVANLAAGAGATALQTAKGNKLAKSITKGLTVTEDPTKVNRVAQYVQNALGIRSKPKTIEGKIVERVTKELEPKPPLKINIPGEVTPKANQQAAIELLNKNAAPDAMDEALNLIRTNKTPVSVKLEYKKPILNYLKSQGGVKVGSNLAAELKAMGVSSKTYPALFKKNGGFSDIDNLSIDDISRAYKGNVPIVGDNKGYLDRDNLLAQIRTEFFNNKRKSSDVEATYDDVLKFLEEYNVDVSTMSNKDIKKMMFEILGDTGNDAPF
ncbi:MAG: hypothetical protein ACRC5T_11210 [Cetobacterium sp.]